MSIAATAQAGAIEIVVADTGIGIAANQIVKVLEPFHQADDCYHRTSGTGLGLPIAKGLIELHGGSLRIDSDVGRGTRAIVRFPSPPSLPAK